MNHSEGIQINKFISSTGFCSRREADKYVEQERVKINGKTALPTSRVLPTDKVSIDDETVKQSKKPSLYLAFNKPKGVTSTTDVKDKTNIVSYVNHNKRIFPIGRLDKDTEGLILLTDDGDIVNKILRSENEHEKEYIVMVDKPISSEFIKKMSSGVEILETITKPCRVYQESSKKFKIVLTQGLNRQIRRMCTALGYEVVALKRVRIMHIKLDKLPVGKYRELMPAELKILQEKLANSVANPESTASKKKSKALRYSKKTPNFAKPNEFGNTAPKAKAKAKAPRKPKKLGRSNGRAPKK